jgi:hypothetical protein
MTALLMVITLVSLALAVAMSVVAWRATRAERLRTAARVAALREAATGPDLPPAPGVAPALEVEDAPWGIDEQPVGAGGLFAMPSGSEGAGHQRALAWAAGGFVVLLAIAGISLMGSHNRLAADPSSAVAPLELLALEHKRTGSAINVSGVVRNPATSHVVEQLTAVVFLLDASGELLSTARAPVDFLRLGPGDDTPFVISMAAPAGAARYRVSFRTGAGLVPHVDRRLPAVVPAGDTRVAGR